MWLAGQVSRPFRAPMPSNGTRRRRNMPQETPVHTLLIQNRTLFRPVTAGREAPPVHGRRRADEVPDCCLRGPCWSAPCPSPSYHSTEILAKNHQNTLKTVEMASNSVEWYGGFAARRMLRAAPAGRERGSVQHEKASCASRRALPPMGLQSALPPVCG